MSIEDNAQLLLNCMCLALAAERTPGAGPGWVGSCCLNPGIPSFDSCCETGGEAWARVIEIFPTDPYPTRIDTMDPSRCQTVQWAMHVELGATRCICFDMCSCDVKQENAHKILGDAEAALRGIICCSDSGSCVGTDPRIAGLAIIGPEGGCGGFKIDVIVRDQFCCPT